MPHAESRTPSSRASRASGAAQRDASDLEARRDVSSSAEPDASAAVDQARAALDAADSRILDGGNGALIVRLVEPVQIGGAELTRVTVGRVRVRHVLACRGAASAMEAYAARLVEPAGAFEELATDDDYIAVLRATERALGNFHGGGKASSRS